MIFSPVPVRGHRLLSGRVNGLTFSYSRHRESVAKHAHRETMIVLGCSGAFEETYTGRIRPATCTVGTALVRPAGELHADRFATGGARDVAIELDPAVLDRLDPWRGVLSAVGRWQDRHIGALAQRIHAELERGDPIAFLALEALTLEVLAFIFRSTSPSGATDTNPVWLQRIRAFIHDQWRDRDIRLGDLADIAGVHPIHVARVYRSRFGETPAGSIRRLRIEWVAHQLVASRKSLSELALEAGFADQSHFTRMFRAAFGTTPRLWRRAAGKA